MHGLRIVALDEKQPATGVGGALLLMVITPRGPVPPSVPFAVAVGLVMALGLALEVVSLVACVVVWLVLVAYVIFTWRTGTSGGTG